MENFGKYKILQVDNGTEFKNKVLEKYCYENNIKLVHSSHIILKLMVFVR